MIFPVPSQAALHFTLVVVNVVVNAAGSIIVAVAVAVHPFASATVATYAPAVNELAVAACIVPFGVHVYKSSGSSCWSYYRKTIISSKHVTLPVELILAVTCVG